MPDVEPQPANARELCVGVRTAVELLGTGFIQAQPNQRLRNRLRSGELDPSDFFRQLLCVTYRLLFLLVAEERGLLHPPETREQARARYARRYSMCRLLDLSPADGGPDEGEPWRMLSHVTSSLARAEGSPEIGLPGHCSYLWLSGSTPDLLGPSETEAGSPVSIGNDAFLGAVGALGVASPNNQNRRALRSEDLSDAYEGVLGFVPVLDLDAATFNLRPGRSSERRVTGSYYTPEPLVQSLLDSALDPVIAGRLRQADGAGSSRPTREAAILGIRVCDPAVGSGRFLLGAARRLACELARVRSQPDPPTPDERLCATRDVIARCVYGVDLNPMAAELCKITLWLEAAEPGKPLSCLDGQIRVGNALLGATPAHLRRGIPDSSFVALEGDDPRLVARYKKRNRLERGEPHGTEPGPDVKPAPAGEHARLVADAWCAAFVWPMPGAGSPSPEPCHLDAITDSVFRTIEQRPGDIRAEVRDEIRRLAREHGFFHWRLEFPEVFREPHTPQATPPAQSRERPPRGGFDVMIGNPPFLNQLETATANQRGVAGMLEALSDGALRGYADLSAAFFLLCVGLTAPGGRVALVQPLSLLAAKDAGPVRARLVRDNALAALWVSNEHLFEGAAVYTCAPTIHVRGPRRGPVLRSSSRAFTPLDPLEIDNDELVGMETWAHLAAAASGIPEPKIRAAGCINDIASATADFRDEYYGLAGFLVEDARVRDGRDHADDRFPPIVTSGLIDLAVCRWGRARTRILKEAWDAPRVDRRRIESEGTLGGWVRARLVPKVIVATQTKVLEAYADQDGRFLPSTPLISVFPRDLEDLWRIAAVIGSPICTAVAMQRYAGAAMSADALKLSARQVARLPLPCDRTSWEDGAALFRRAQETEDQIERSSRLASFGEIMCAAYSLSGAQTDRLMAWWTGRLAPRSAGVSEAFRLTRS